MNDTTQQRRKTALPIAATFALTLSLLGAAVAPATGASGPYDGWDDGWDMWSSSESIRDDDRGVHQAVIGTAQGCGDYNQLSRAMSFTTYGDLSDRWPGAQYTISAGNDVIGSWIIPAGKVTAEALRSAVEELPAEIIGREGLDITEHGTIAVWVVDDYYGEGEYWGLQWDHRVPPTTQELSITVDFGSVSHTESVSFVGTPDCRPDADTPDDVTQTDDPYEPEDEVVVGVVAPVVQDHVVELREGETAILNLLDGHDPGTGEIVGVDVLDTDEDLVSTPGHLVGEDGGYVVELAAGDYTFDYTAWAFTEGSEGEGADGTASNVGTVTVRLIVDEEPELVVDEPVVPEPGESEPPVVVDDPEPPVEPEIEVDPPREPEPVEPEPREPREPVDPPIIHTDPGAGGNPAAIPAMLFGSGLLLSAAGIGFARRGRSEESGAV